MKRAARVVLIVCCALAAGCLHRQLAIRSEPAGADILVNDKPIGKTPTTYNFLWYGTYRIILTKTGYEPLNDLVLINAPPSLWIPLDLLAELAPFPVWDRRELSYTLSPPEALPEPTPPVHIPTDQPSATSSPTRGDAHGQDG